MYLCSNYEKNRYEKSHNMENPLNFGTISIILGMYDSNCLCIASECRNIAPSRCGFASMLNLLVNLMNLLANLANLLANLKWRLSKGRRKLSKDRRKLSFRRGKLSVRMRKSSVRRGKLIIRMEKERGKKQPKS